MPGDATHRVRFQFSADSHRAANDIVERVAREALRQVMAASETPEALGWMYVTGVEPAELVEDADSA
jgi:hypothetical protein